jgi:phosphoglycolate phosphatase-like HAD superfamily hydrolase
MISKIHFPPVAILIFLFGILGCDPKTNEPSKERTAEDPLPSWNAGPAKNSIVEFIESSTSEGPSFIPEMNRIIVFDNDGTLWSEQPMYFQFLFALHRIREMAPVHPEWKDKQPFKAVLENDLETLKSIGMEGLLTMLMTTHAGMTTQEFQKIASNWMDTARHPTTGKRFKEMVYQPMLELLTYFRSNGFKTYIVSGGGVDFMRVFTQEVYGIPPEQVIGSRNKILFEYRDGDPYLVKLPELDFIDDGNGKPIAIHHIIGKKPVAAFGNSDGDLPMLQWTASGEGKRLMVYIHHTDAEREWAYDRESHIGKLNKGLDEATEKGWTVVDMKKDWNKIFPVEE